MRHEDLVIRGRGLWDALGFTSKPGRIHGMLFERSENIHIEGIQLRTGGWWQTNFLLSSDIEIEHMTLMRVRWKIGAAAVAPHSC